MLRRCSRGGVPVLSRPISKPQSASDAASSSRRRLAGAAGGMLLVADVDQAVQERAGRDDERRHVTASPSSNASPVTRLAVRANPARRAEKPGDVRLVRSAPREPSARTPRLSACARGDQTAGPRLRFSSLNWMPGRVDGAAHQPAERVDLAHQVALGRAADRGIAGHQRDGVRRQRAPARRGIPCAPPPTRLRSRRGRRRSR